MSPVMKKIDDIADDPDFSDGEKQYLEHLLGLSTNVMSALWDLLEEAYDSSDKSHIERLRKVYPLQVDAYENYVLYDLKQRFKAKGYIEDN